MKEKTKKGHESDMMMESLSFSVSVLSRATFAKGKTTSYFEVLVCGIVINHKND